MVDYLGFVSPPQPPSPHGEGLLFEVVAPLYVVVAVIVGYLIGKRDYLVLARGPLVGWIGGGVPDLREGVAFGA